MSMDSISGKAQVGIGRLEETAGDALGRADLKVKGEARQFEGRARELVGAAKDAVGRAADQARQAVATARDRAADAYVELLGKAQQTADAVEPFVKQRPYAALGIAAAAGLVLGILIAGRGPKVIYVKPQA